MKARDCLSITDLGCEDINLLLRDAREIKAAGWVSYLANKTLALLFEKPSLRTRVSFEVAMRQAGGECVYLSPAEVGLGSRESVPDVARVLSRYVDIIAARTFSHRTIEILGEYADVPVINALSDAEHPCQALTDMFTIYEKKGDLRGLTLAYIGDGNNIANSLMLGASMVGMNFRIASPEGYHIKCEVIDRARAYAEETGCSVFMTLAPGVERGFSSILIGSIIRAIPRQGRPPTDGKRSRRTASFPLCPLDPLCWLPLPCTHGYNVPARRISWRSPGTDIPASA